MTIDTSLFPSPPMVSAKQEMRNACHGARTAEAESSPTLVTKQLCDLTEVP